MSTILMDAIAGNLVPFEKPHVTFANVLYKVTGVSRDPDAAAADDEDDATADDATANALFNLTDANINMGVTFGTVASAKA